MRGSDSVAGLFVASPCPQPGTITFARRLALGLHAHAEATDSNLMAGIFLRCTGPTAIIALPAVTPVAPLCNIVAKDSTHGGHFHCAGGQLFLTGIRFAFSVGSAQSMRESAFAGFRCLAGLLIARWLGRFWFAVSQTVR